MAQPDRAEGSAPSGRSSGRWFWIVLGLVLAVELWLFGRRGEVEVCVGKAGVHDFDLVGQVRTDANRWSVPRCEARPNLGLRNDYTGAVTEATRAACRGATTFRHRDEADACASAEAGWERRVTARFVPPWDARYRNELFWFLP